MAYNLLKNNDVFRYMGLFAPNRPLTPLISDIWHLASVPAR